MTNTTDTPAIIANLERLLDGPRDGALLRYSLGNEWLKAGDARKATEFLRNCLARDPGYSAAWKLLGKALSSTGETDAALEAFNAGIRAAEAKSDVQAAKEMAVFAKRLRREISGT